MLKKYTNSSQAKVNESVLQRSIEHCKVFNKKILLTYFVATMERPSFASVERRTITT